MIGVTEQRGQDGGTGDLIEDDAEGNRGGLDRRKVWNIGVSECYREIRALPLGRMEGVRPGQD